MPHPESEHGLRVQLATALRERDEARALAEKWARREAAGVERGIRADADALSEIQGLQEALAAARRECGGLKAALAVAAENLCLEGPDHDKSGSPPCGDPICTGCVARTALASPAAGEEKSNG